MKKIAASLLLIFLAFAIIQTLLVQAVTPKENAIDLGLAWLAGQQDLATGAWNLGFCPVASTAFAILKFAEYRHTTGDKTYDHNVTSGLTYVLGYAVLVNISVQTVGYSGRSDDPDTNHNGIGIYFQSTSGLWYGELRPTYETGIVMMAFEALNRSGFINPGDSIPSGPIVGRTYREVMEDMMNYYAWAQCDNGNGRGGWRYTQYDNAGGDSDNSVSQWPVLGLMSASAWGINAPDWVKSELLNHWLVHSQALVNGVYGGFGYTDNSSLNIGRTAAGLIELTYCGVLTTSLQWIGARSYIGTNWLQPLEPPPIQEDGNIGNFYAMYAVMKAAMTAQPGVIWDFGGHTWQGEYDDYLVNVSQVKPDGYWPAQWDTTGVLSTEWALLILEKVAPPVLSPRALIDPTSAKIKIGENVTFTSSVSGGSPPYSYQWYLNGSAVSDATSFIWTFAPTSVQPIGNYTVYVIVTDSLTNTATSNTAIVTVAPPLLVSISPMSASMLSGQSVTFTSTTSGGYPPYSHQWYLNSNPAPDATSSTWTFTPTTPGTYYVYLNVIDTTNNTALSDTARIIFTPAPVGGYSVSIEAHAASKPLTPYLALTAILCIGLVTIKRKVPRRKK